MTTVTTKSAHDMTEIELQAEIGRLQSILTYKVLGDPMTCVSVPIKEGYTFLNVQHFPLSDSTSVKK